MKSHTYLLILGLILPLSSLESKMSLKEFSSFFGTYPYEDIIMKEFELSKGGTLVLKNLNGDITVKTGTEQNKIYVTAIKRSKKQEVLNDLLINHKYNKKDNTEQLAISSSFKNKQTRGMINYVVTIPPKTNLLLATESGNIFVNKSDGHTQVKTAQGKITVNNSTSKLIAHNENGPITINHASGTVKAVTDIGDINLNDITGSVVAEASKGHINSICSSIHPTNKLQLHTDAGAITLALPATVNANFYGKTARGTLLCELPITIKPITTKLDSATWKRFRQEVDGILGTGEAEIRLSSTSGNIKVIETT